MTAVDLRGVPRAYEQEIEHGLTTQPTPRLLLFALGVYEWQTLDQEALSTDILRIERQLRRRGYFEARVVAVRVVRKSEQLARVEVDVEPGERVIISDISMEGMSALPFDAAAHGAHALTLKKGEPFDEAAYEQAKLEVANALSDVGYAYARVGGTAHVDLATRRAQVRLKVTAGPRATLGRVSVEGLVKVPEAPVAAALQLREGETYSRKKLSEARAALFRLGVFSRVDVIPLLNDQTSTQIPITVRLEEGALHNVTAGAGASLDVLRLAARARLSWVDKNFLGGLRKLSVSTRPGITFFPTRLDNLLEQAPTHLIPENALSIALEQPAFIEGRTKGVAEAGYNVYPLLYPLPDGSSPQAETVIGYHEVTSRLGLTRPFFNGRLPISLSANWRSNFPFAYQGSVASGLEPVTVTYPELEVMYDGRDDPIAPTRGFLLQNSLQVAVPLVSHIMDVRIRPELRTYVPLTFQRNLVLATRFTVGLLLPTGYGDTLLAQGASGAAGTDYTDPDVIRDQHALLFRAFYSGGPNSNRGYPYQRIGPQGPVGFLVPTGTQCQGPLNGLAPTCIRPLGGFSLWEASLELRWHVSGPWGLVAFADASDVSSRLTDFNFLEPHLSIGPGLRYASPVGAVRLDLGWRVPGLQQLATNPDEPPDVSQVQPYVDQTGFQGLAFSILIGEAF